MPTPGLSGSQPGRGGEGGGGGRKEEERDRSVEEEMEGNEKVGRRRG